MESLLVRQQLGEGRSWDLMLFMILTIGELDSVEVFYIFWYLIALLLRVGTV